MGFYAGLNFFASLGPKVKTSRLLEGQVKVETVLTLEGAAGEASKAGEARGAQASQGKEGCVGAWC